MEKWFENAVSHPWPFISVGMMYVAYLLIRKLFADNGLVSRFLDGIREDSQSMKDAITSASSSQVESNELLRADLVASFEGNKISIDRLEKQLVTAMQARPNDEELFDVLFTNHPLPVCFVGADFRFTKVNNACSEFLGYSFGELSRMKFTDVTEDGDVEVDVENASRLASGSLTRVRMEKNYVRKNGNVVGAVLYVYRYPGRGVFLHYIAVIIPAE